MSDQTNQRNDRIRNTAKGLADSLRFAGTGTQEPQWTNLHQLSMPVHLIVGELDNKFRTIAKDMQPLLRSSEVKVVPNVGHTVHLEDPATTGLILDSIILRHD